MFSLFILHIMHLQKLKIVYQKSTAVLRGNQNRMTWTDYFATVGGLLGLLGILGINFFCRTFLALFGDFIETAPIL
jgi:hypothetical protein